MNAPLSSVAISIPLAAVSGWSGFIDQAVSSAALQRMGWVLLHFLWQGSAVAALLLIALALLQRQSAAIRYRIACAAMLAMAVAPVATYWIIAREASSGLVEDVGRSSITTPDLPVYSIQPNNAQAISVASEPSTPVASKARMMTAAARSASPAKSPWTWIVACWAAGVAALSAWRAGGWLRLRWLIRRSIPLGQMWTERAQTLALCVGVRRAVRLMEAAWVAVPCVLGFFRPVILVPAAALTGLTPAQLEAVLAHELAHIRRHDYLINLVQAALETVLFYHPAVWWVSARIREEREFCCDDLAAATRPSPAEYADALAAAEALRAIEARSLPPHLALAALDGRRTNGSLLRRVRRILGLPPVQRGRAITRHSLTAIVVAVACVAMPWVVVRGDKAPTTGRTLDAPSGAAPVTAPSTAPAKAAVDEFAAAKPPGPDDLVVDRKDYAISPSDLLTIEIADLTGPGTQTVKTRRVSETGSITMPLLAGSLAAAGRNVAQLERDIIKAYSDQHVIQNAQVSVMVSEARGRTFSVLGNVPRPGQYAIMDPNFRLLDALFLAGADPTQLNKIYVVRKPKVDQADVDALRLKLVALEHTLGANNPAAVALRQQLADANAPRSRIIAVPASGLVDGDPKSRVVIRPGDMLITRGSSRSQVRMVVSPDGGLTFRGERTTWAELYARFGRMPAAERARTSLAIAPATDQMTLRQLNDAVREAKEVSKLFGLGDVQVLTVPAVSASPIKPTTEPATTR